MSWLVGPRDGFTAAEFMQDVASRVANRIQLSSDGHHTYWGAVGNAYDHPVAD